MELQRLRNVTNPFFAVNRVEPAKVLAVSKVEYASTTQFGFCN